MKKIINGKMYNTETAKVLGTACSSAAVNSFEYWEETLYKKKTGEYFLYGHGGAASQYARRVDANSWSDGDGFVPLTETQAMKWAEMYFSADDYCEIFGEPEE